MEPLLDPTFRNYDAEQAADYALHRGSYAPQIIQEVISRHATRGGAFDVLLDVGCGTGNATRHLASYFERAVGCDAGAEMVAQAVRIGGRSKGERAIGYHVLDAESLDRAAVITPGSVDLLTAAMSAHWFRMDQFWHQAARLVKPGGTVAIWTMSSLFCHPSTPNARAVQQSLGHLEDNVLGPYASPQNQLSRRMYQDLPVPWTLGPALAAAFPEASFSRREWNREGRLEPGEDDFFGGSTDTPLTELAAALGTASMVTRWREAHPEAVGTEGDCVVQAMAAVKKAMGFSAEKGSAADPMLRTGSATVLLMFSRS